MKLHDLRPATGSRHPRKRVGRGIAAGGGKTAGRGTKGQKARAGASIPAWFEGGQTPLQQRIPKLHGFKNRFRVEYEVVNLGRIAALVDAGIFEPGDAPGAKKAGSGSAAGSRTPAPITINQEILRAAGLVSTLKKPLKVLGNGDLSAALFVVADAFSRSAVTKIEAAGGSVQVLEVPSGPLAALGVEVAPEGAAPVAGKPDHGHDGDHDHDDHDGDLDAAPAAVTASAAAASAEPVAEPAAKPKASTTSTSAAKPKPAMGTTAKAAAPTAAKTPKASAPEASAKSSAPKASAKSPAKGSAKSASKPASKPAAAKAVKAASPTAKAAKPASGKAAGKGSKTSPDA
jgi:large subunit ribosomal protein L15